MISMLKYKGFSFLFVVAIFAAVGFWLQQGVQQDTEMAPVGQNPLKADGPFSGFEGVLAREDFYSKNVQPVLNSKCVACHSCYNSPCQLDLTSYEGLMRGASPINLYDFPKLKAREPTRVFIDAHTSDDWREKGIFSVVAGGEKSILHRLVSELPGIESEKQEKYESEYSRICMKDFSNESFEVFRDSNPGGRMPFGFPGVTSEELGLFSQWYGHNFVGPKTSDMELTILNHEAFSEFVRRWESFFNARGLRQKLVSRYFYEHLFLAHLYFKEQPHVFFRLVRSQTKSGNIKEVATSFPFEDPGGEFFYRLRPVTHTLAHKTHIPFELTDQKRQQWKKDFLDTPWLEALEKMPEYGLEGSNPFKTFSALPTEAKYRMFLENSSYFIMTFIKGPVCRGQTALNVINDHFWVLFMDPSRDVMVQDREAYKKISSQIEFPALIGDEFDPLISFRKKYWGSIHTKFEELRKGRPLDLKSLWSGNRKNDNASITVLRHYDSATVLKGLRSHMPKTIWVLDYHVFESIYYNLSAGYNVFGPLLHQLNSRMFMEVSRVASEDLFLSFLPKQSRIPLRKQWNQPAPAEKETFVKQFVDFLTEDASEKLSNEYVFSGGRVEIDIPFVSSDVKSEMLKKVQSQVLTLKQYAPSSRERKYGTLLRELEDLPTDVIQRLPEASVVYLEGRRQLWTLVHNKAHYNIAMILFENQRRKPEQDNLSVIDGVATSYANLIFHIPPGEEKDFVRAVKALKSQMDVVKLYRKYAVSRKDTDFWNIYSQVTQLTHQPLTNERGPLDLNRYIMW